MEEDLLPIKNEKSVYRFLNFIARKRVTFAKFVSDKKGDFY